AGNRVRTKRAPQKHGIAPALVEIGLQRLVARAEQPPGRIWSDLHDDEISYRPFPEPRAEGANEKGKLRAGSLPGSQVDFLPRQHDDAEGRIESGLWRRIVVHDDEARHGHLARVGTAVREEIDARQKHYGIGESDSPKTPPNGKVDGCAVDRAEITLDGRLEPVLAQPRRDIRSSASIGLRTRRAPVDIIPIQKPNVIVES